MFGLSNCLLKQIINSIAVPLVHIINQSIKTGQIPSQLKIAKVLPIFKYSNSSKMDKCNPGNYRPISLLPIFSKLLEKIVSEQLTRYLEFNQIITNFLYNKARSPHLLLSCSLMGMWILTLTMISQLASTPKQMLTVLLVSRTDGINFSKLRMTPATTRKFKRSSTSVTHPLPP